MRNSFFTDDCSSTRINAILFVSQKAEIFAHRLDSAARTPRKTASLIKKADEWTRQPLKALLH
jgi:hypothetical protein